VAFTKEGKENVHISHMILFGHSFHDTIYGYSGWRDVYIFEINRSEKVRVIQQVQKLTGDKLSASSLPHAISLTVTDCHVIKYPTYYNIVILRMGPVGRPHQ